MHIIAVSGVWYNYRSFLGDQASGALLILLLGIKIFETHRKSDYFFSGLLCLLVLMSYALNSQGLAMTVFLIVDVTLVLAYLFTLEAESRAGAQWRGLVRMAVSLAFKSSPILVLMFFLFPRFSTGIGSTNSSQAKMGINDQMRPGTISQLMGSEELVFRATFLNGEMPRSNSLYWRAAVLDQSDGLNWGRQRETGQRSVGAGTRRDVEIYLEPGYEKFLFVLDPTQRLHFPNESAVEGVRFRSGEIYELMQPARQRERYFLEVASESPVEEKPGPVYTRVKVPPSPRMKEFLARMRGKSAYHTVQDLLAHLNTGGYSYSLQPPPAQGIDAFFFTNKVGFCEHYAGSFATVLRYLSIPARVVVGFQGGSPSFLENFVSLRGHDAHAWVEYYDDSVSRWRRVDPTAQVAPQRLSLGSEDYLNPQKSSWYIAYLRGRAFIDEVDSQWTVFLLRYDLARQKDLLESFGLENVPYQVLVVFLVLGLVLFASVIYFFEARKREFMPPEERLYRSLLKAVDRWKIGRAAHDGPLTLSQKVAAQGPEKSEAFLAVLEPLITVRFGGQTLSKELHTTLTRRLRALRKLRR